MQQELNIKIIKNTNILKNRVDIKSLCKSPMMKLAVFLVIGFLFGRVNLFLNINDEKGVAPFGLAYLLILFSEENKRKYIAAALGVLLGYISIKLQVAEIYSYMLCILSLSILYFCMPKNLKKIAEYIKIPIIFCVFVFSGLLILKYEININLMVSLLQIIIILPVYYITRYGMNAVGNIRVNKNISVEEITSVIIILCLIVTGVGNISIYQCSFRNIVALIIVFIIAYCGGAAYGTMVGVAMGTIGGLSVNSMEFSIALFGIGGLVVGVFKDTGKIVSVISGVLMCFIVGMYSNCLNLQLIIEVLIGAGLFLIIPKHLYKNIEIEINPEKRKCEIYKDNLEGIKEQFRLKVSRLTDVMYAISNCLNETTVKNNVCTSKGSALIENLADRSCSQCINRNICWKKEFHNTYASFQTLINNYQNGKKIIPSELQNKCIKQSSITKNTESVVKNYNAYEIVKDQLFEGRKILSQHICSIGSTLNRMLDELRNKVVICTDMEKNIRKVLNKNDVFYNEVFCYTDYNGRIKIRIAINNYQGYDYCANSIIPQLSKVVKTSLTITNEEHLIKDEEDNICTITIEEAPKYYIMSYAAVAVKDGENQTGDYYSFGKTANGDYTFILSDGMGSGNEAALQSKSIVNLTEHLTDAGFASSIIVDTINSIMSAKFSENEKYATLDLGSVNLYNGNASFIKMGAAPSFIKRNKKVIKIASNNLPFGVVDEVEAEVINERLTPGDIILSLSDGILDIDKSNAGDDSWIEEYLKENNYDPAKLSKSILDKAKSMSEQIIKDDMTVIVSKMYCV